MTVVGMGLVFFAVFPGCETAAVEGTSCVENLRAQSRSPARSFDVLLVVDRSVSMSSYVDTLEEHLEELGIGMDSADVDLHLSSIAADLGAGGVRARDCSAGEGDFVFELQEPWWRCSDLRTASCSITNRTAPLGETTACVGAFGSGAVEPPRPFDAILRVLDSREPELEGFLRPNATFVAIVITAGDDASTVGAEELLAALQARSPPNGNHLLYIIAPAGSVRLDAAVDQRFIHFSAIEDREWAIFDFFVGPLTPFTGRCLPDTELVDTDPNNPGVQLAGEFQIEESSGPGDLETIPWCQMATPSRPHPGTGLPCAWLDLDPGPEFGSCSAVVFLEAPRGQRVRGVLQREIDCPEP